MCDGELSYACGVLGVLCVEETLQDDEQEQALRDNQDVECSYTKRWIKPLSLSI